MFGGKGLGSVALLATIAIPSAGCGGEDPGEPLSVSDGTFRGCLKDQAGLRRATTYGDLPRPDAGAKLTVFEASGIERGTARLERVPLARDGGAARAKLPHSRADGIVVFAFPTNAKKLRFDTFVCVESAKQDRNP